MYAIQFNTEIKKLIYGTTVIYNKQIGIIKSRSETDNINIQLCIDNSIISVKKNKLKIILHNKNELIKFKNVYYII
jgi:hypothetical protein